MDELILLRIDSILKHIDQDFTLPLIPNIDEKTFLGYVCFRKEAKFDS